MDFEQIAQHIMAALIENSDAVALEILRQTIENRIVYEFMIFRTDGFLKTQLFAEDASLLAYRAFLRAKFRNEERATLARELRREPTGKEVNAALNKKVEEEIYKYVMVITCHEDIDPDKPYDGPSGVLMKQLGEKRGPGRSSVDRLSWG